ncbi:sugar transferase, partial [Lacticaseibacillus paracasei]|uniref:sugar transferase n=1 Tax=Lacticaseibacillus paracasei TaxID=1597 RepID=UPI0021A79131
QLLKDGFVVNTILKEADLFCPNSVRINFTIYQYTNYDRQRLAVIPGVTGLWQVSGRNELDFSEMVALDIRYINHACLSQDIKILFKTVLVVIHPAGAY